MFSTYLQLGFDHILDIQGYDHILFILSITLLYTIFPLRSLIILVTAFTIGHSITLALSAMSIIEFPSKWIELLIPITIILSCLDNLYSAYKSVRIFSRYVITLLFGFIHGMGFSSFFRSIIGKEDSIIPPLASFNIGVELAQLLILLMVVVILFFLKKLKVKPTYILTLGSMLILLVSVWLFYKQVASF